MGALSLTHWLLIIFILLLFFGPHKPADAIKSIGKAIRNFKSAKNEIELKEGKDYVDKANDKNS
jgi:TatA/E family protein of Tat protein translocase